jgi:hypothetical protein
VAVASGAPAQEAQGWSIAHAGIGDFAIWATVRRDHRSRGAVRQGEPRNRSAVLPGDVDGDGLADFHIEVVSDARLDAGDILI